MPHTIKIERKGNELVVHLALIDSPRPTFPDGVLLHTEGWVDIGYGMKMFLVIGAANRTYHNDPLLLHEKRGRFSWLRPKKTQPLLPP